LVGVCVHPVVATQPSSVQGFASSQLMAVPPWQVPPEQV
jgi:hypothetical protein